MGKKKKKTFEKTLWKKVKLLRMSNFTVFHNAFYTACILKAFKSYMSVAVCSFFEFGTVSKWCSRELVNYTMTTFDAPGKKNGNRIFSMYPQYSLPDERRI